MSVVGKGEGEYVLSPQRGEDSSDKQLGTGLKLCSAAGAKVRHVHEGCAKKDYQDQKSGGISLS